MQPAVLAAGFSWFYFLLIGLNRKYKGSLMAKHYVLAMLCIMAQIMFNPAWAEVTSPTTVTSTTSQDAIQTFVKSDFATRRAMLNQWPASIEQLDQLVAYIDQNELYTDSSGHTYILKNDEKLLSYPQLQVIYT